MNTVKYFEKYPNNSQNTGRVKSNAARLYFCYYSIQKKMFQSKVAW